MGLLRDAGMPVADYLALLKTEAHRALGHHADPSLRNRTVAASWTVAFERLEADNPAALLLLTLAAWLAPEPIPLTVFTQHPDRLPDLLRSVVSDPIDAAAFTGLIQRRGLAEVTAQTIRLHRVPAALLRDRDTTGRGETGLNDIAHVLAAAVPRQPWEVATWPTWRLLLPHVLAVVDRQSDGPDGYAADDITYYLLKKATSYLYSQGQPQLSLSLSERVYQRRLSRSGPDHPKTLQAAGHLARILYAAADYQRARILDEDTLARTRRVLGEHHPDTFTSAHRLARDLHKLGDDEQARCIHESTLAGRRRLLGEDHPDTIESAGELARSLVQLGDYEQAYSIRKHTVEYYRRVRGEDHLDTLGSVSGLAGVLSLLGAYKEARALAEDTLVRYRLIVGEDHHFTLKSATNLGACLYNSGDYQQARSLLEETLDRQRRVLGEDHPLARRSAANLAQVLRRLGEAPQ